MRPDLLQSPDNPDATPSGTHSLRQLRAEMLQRAAAVAARARSARRRGELHTAKLLEERAAKLVEIARSVKIT